MRINRNIITFLIPGDGWCRADEFIDAFDDIEDTDLMNREQNCDTPSCAFHRPRRRQMSRAIEDKHSSSDRFLCLTRTG
ncbi:MAG: hypothetical protein A4E62_02724 [Syntrophorhabdus sp. PtaU1.Bin002]|nr:MAG: hypothetical protein A4E58_00132 [Syntrophorhabdus sp. PtaB.Bin006]OPY65241.1 MAG: hypothetical protein A4E62_02724 [Syntrophorhabdus sp. PtaU1.Bin002]